MRVALVTGGAKRLGRRLALELASLGYSVVVNYRSSADAAAEVVREIEAAGGVARAFAADVGNTAQVEAMFASVAQIEGRLDVLVNNVGNYEPKPLAEVTPASWDAQIRTNLNGSFACCHFARPLMAQGGCIVNIGYAGVDALVSNPDATAYQVSKTGLLVLTKSIAQGWAPIRSNMLSPGQLANSIDLPEDLDTIPAGRAGTLDDMAAALRFVLEASYVTGVNIDVAGGYRLQGS